MTEEPFIKICGITNEADALLAAGLGATALGFIFAPASKRLISREDARDIIRRVPSSVATVGVFRNQPLFDVIDIAAELGLTAVQLHGDESRDDAKFVADQMGCVIKAFVAGDPEVNHFRSYGASYFLLDGPEPGSGELFDWSITEGVPEHSAMIVSGGLRPDNVGLAIRQLRPYGVDVCSHVEAEPGRKDPLALRDFIRNAREAFDEIGARHSDNDTEFFDWGSE